MAEADRMQMPGAPDNDEVLKKRLVKRVTVAGLVVVGLLGALVIFDGFFVKMEKAPKRIASVEAPIKPIEKPAVVEEPVAVEQATEAADSTSEPAAEPERTETPTGRAERPLTVPATARSATMRSGEPAAAPRKPQAAKEVARVLPPAEGTSAPASRPIARAVEFARQFLVQVGVFGNLANAEELRAKLENAGVPAHIEARVQVGPFATRQEAEQAREKMKTLGVEPGIIMTRK